MLRSGFSRNQQRLRHIARAIRRQQRVAIWFPFTTKLYFSRPHGIAKHLLCLEDVMNEKDSHGKPKKSNARYRHLKTLRTAVANPAVVHMFCTTPSDNMSKPDLRSNELTGCSKHQHNSSFIWIFDPQLDQNCHCNLLMARSRWISF